MHHANHFYGHAHLLAEYCGLDAADPPRIRGYLQHGWNVTDGLGHRTPYVPGMPIFVWSQQTRRRAAAMGRRYAVVTGAPWLYLLALSAAAESKATESPAAESPAAEEAREGTIWYPFHGWERQRVHGDHRRLIAEIAATEDGPVTVCLYWHEHRDARIRRAYERAGFRVVCHGNRGLRRHGTDPAFLRRQLAELRRHRRVAANRLSSAVLYGAVVGCEPAVYGDPMHLAGEDTQTRERIRRQWAELHGVAPDPATARQVALAELGGPDLAGPAELRELLGWGSADLAGPAEPRELFGWGSAA